jgi:hypothetical protein
MTARKMIARESYDAGQKILREARKRIEQDPTLQQDGYEG